MCITIEVMTITSLRSVYIQMHAPKISFAPMEPTLAECSLLRRLASVGYR